MEYLWAPWRIQYIQMKKSDGCILCEIHKRNNDEQHYILHRGSKNFISLNSFPYNPGHLLVSPYRHVASLENLTEEERNEHFALVSRSIKVLRAEFKPGGFNMGANLGKVAGAGIDDHFHSHIVPRWQGDTNCIPVVSNTRVIPEALMDTYKKLKGKF